MLEFIPIKYYTSINYIILFFILLFLFLYSSFVSLNTKFKNNRRIFEIISIFYLLFIILYIGLRPIHNEFVDMIEYNNMYEEIQKYDYDFNSIYSILTLGLTNDLFFDIYMYFCSLIMPASIFFLTISILYIFPIFIVSYAFFKERWFYSFIFFVSTISFWAYGTNTIRAGVASSILLLLFFFKKRLLKFLVMCCAFGMHASMMTPILAYLIAYVFRNTKIIVLSWFLIILLSFFGGNFFQHFFAKFITDNRTVYLTVENTNTEIFSSIGFRWDFVFYSGLPIIWGYLFIFYKNFQDKTYGIIYRMYVVANGVWILVIYANFSDRFAYLSWFMLPLVIMYPLLYENRVKSMRKQHQKISWVILLNFSFTLFVNIILPLL